MDFLCRRLQKMEKLAGRLEPSKRRITVRIILDICIWLSVSLPGLYLFLRGTPYEQGFFCDDPSLDYPDVPETVSTRNLIVVGMSVSIVMVILVEVLNCLDRKCRRRNDIKDDISHCINSYIVFLIGIAVQLLAVEVIKNHMGTLRPNFFHVCQPQFNRTSCPGFITEYSCTGNDLKNIRNSRQSFPSGHTSFSVYIAIYFCIYIQRRLHVSFSRLLKFMLQGCLIFAAILCGLGRIKDFQHHPQDIVAGAILGGAVAVLMSLYVLDQTSPKVRNKSFTESSTESIENGHTCISDDECSVCVPRLQLQNKDPSPLLEYRD